MRTCKANMKEIVAVKCIDCMCGDSVAVVECTSPGCPLFSARPRNRPDGIKSKYWDDEAGCLKMVPELRRRVVTDEQREAARERLNKARAAQ